jgi:hypothetical protein
LLSIVVGAINNGEEAKVIERISSVNKASGPFDLLILLQAKTSAVEALDGYFFIFELILKFCSAYSHCLHG